MLLILQEMFHLSQINIPAIQSNSGLSTYDNAATKSVSIAARLYYILRKYLPTNFLTI